MSQLLNAFPAHYHGSSLAVRQRHKCQIRQIFGRYRRNAITEMHGLALVGDSYPVNDSFWPRAEVDLRINNRLWQSAKPAIAAIQLGAIGVEPRFLIVKNLGSTPIICYDIF